MDAATEARWDRARDYQKHEPSPRHQKRAVVELVGYLHGLLCDGLILSPEIEKQLRARANTVCTEFGIDKLPPAQPRAAYP